MRIVADRNIARAAEAFAPFGSVALVDGRALTRADLQQADTLLVRSVTRVDAALLDGTPVRRVGTATAGVDHVDQPYLAAAGVEFAAAPGCNARAVGEYVLACLLAHCLARDIEPASLTLGIVGHGHAGTAVANLAIRLGVRCLLNDPPRATREPGPYVGLDEALAADVVTLHVPLADRGPCPTRGFIGARELARLGARALLVNAARGGVVDEMAWCARLRAAPDQRAVVDCWQGEPNVNLGLLERAWIATPHVAGHTIDARERATAMLRDWLAERCGPVTPWRSNGAGKRSVIATGAAEAPWREAARAVLACCDPRAQTARLRATRDEAPAARAAAFDALRAAIGRRREFTRYAVASVAPGSDTAKLLTDLGFALAGC